MKKADLRRRIAEYQTLSAQIAELEKQKEAVAAKIKRGMGDSQELQVDDFIIRYKEVVSRRFDSTAFRAAYADLYNQFTRASTSRRFTVTA